MLRTPVGRAESLILQFPKFERNTQTFDAGLASQCVKEESDMGIQIRTATDADLPSILALYVQVEDDGRVLSVEEARPIFARMRSYPDYKVYVATLDGSIVGTFALLIMENLAHKGAPSGVLEDVVVQGDWQHRGVGKQMMQFVMDRCRERGCYKLALSSNLKREAAHRFYSGLGFRRHGYSFVVEVNQAQDHAKP
jgi:GNAT superfamily N-acetyltransferase